MPNLNAFLNDHIRRLARREIRAHSRQTRRLTAQHRRDIAALKRQLALLQRNLDFLQRQQLPHRNANSSADHPISYNGTPHRFRADGLRSHRAKLGLSAKDYGRLLNVSALTIYHWESGQSRPRKSHLPQLASLRSIGKRQALLRLKSLD